MRMLAGIFALALWATSAVADANAKANELFVEAVQLWKRAEAVEGDELTQLWKQLDLLKQVEANLDSIVSDYPSSNLAVQLVIGAVGPLEVGQVEASLEELRASINCLSAPLDCALARYGNDRFAHCRAWGTPQIGGPFTLVSETGETVTDKDVIDQPTLLYFGYTFCPDVCPLDTVRNAAAVDILEERGQMVKPVFISIDPDRDTPQVVADFTAKLHPRMLGLTGSPEQVKVVSKAYRIFYQKLNSEDEYYLVDHSTFTYLTLPEHGFVDFFRRDISPKDMADRVGCFLDAM